MAILQYPGRRLLTRQNYSLDQYKHNKQACDSPRLGSLHLCLMRTHADVALAVRTTPFFFALMYRNIVFKDSRYLQIVLPTGDLVIFLETDLLYSTGVVYIYDSMVRSSVITVIC